MKSKRAILVLNHRTYFCRVVHAKRWNLYIVSKSLPLYTVLFSAAYNYFPYLHRLWSAWINRTNFCPSVAVIQYIPLPSAIIILRVPRGGRFWLAQYSSFFNRVPKFFVLKSQWVCTLININDFFANIKFFDSVYTLFLRIEMYNFHYILSQWRYLMYAAFNLTYYYLT